MTRARKVRFATLVVTMVVGTMVGPFLGVPAAPAIDHQVLGTVFQDFDGNGRLDTAADATNPAVDRGVGGVTVTLFDLNGTQLDQTVTAADGTYNVAGSAAVTDDVRLEFSNLPAGFTSSAHGDNSATATQFVKAGTSDNDFAINRPDDYCQANPLLATNCYVMGDQINGANNSSPVIVTVPYNASGTNPAPDHPANAAQVGTTFGLAYQRSTKTLFAAAFTKRHSGFGVGGPGAIYAIAPGTDGVAGTNDDVVGTTPFVTIAGVGADSHPSGPSPDYFHDTATYDEVGKMGLGDLDISADGRTLYVVNLFDRTLVSIPIGDGPTAPAPSAITTAAIPTGDCPNAADARPFALTTRGPITYVGVTCTAQSSGLRSALSARVYAFDGTAFTAVFVMPLTFDRGTNPDNVDETWNPWTASFPSGAPGHPSQRSFAQPMLTDLVWDGDDLVLGFRDRMGDQGGMNVGNLNTADSTTFYSIAYGDILRACGTGVALSAESGGNCGTITHAADTGNITGPGGGEFYWADRYNPNIANNASGNYHYDVTSGGLAQVPGFADVVSTTMDPIGTWSGGLRWFSRATGGRSKGYTLYSGGGPGSPTPNFGKANGIGDVEPLCDAAPVEVGNRVWIDSDGDGVQDPGEPAVAGVTVSLYEGSTRVGAPVVTDSEGRWYFAVTPGHSYTVRLDNSADFGPTGPLAGRVLTLANTGSGGSGSAIDGRDSDASAVADVATIGFTAGDAGHNDHTFDFGFVTAPATPTAPTGPTGSIGDRVWFDDNRNGVQDGAEPGVDGVTVTLFDGNGAVVARRVTAANGTYLFDGLPAGSYRVCFTPPAGVTLTVGGVGGDSVDSDVDPQSTCTRVLTLAAGEHFRTLDAGMVRAGAAELPRSGPPPGPGGAGTGGLAAAGVIALGAGLVVLLRRRVILNGGHPLRLGRR